MGTSTEYFNAVCVKECPSFDVEDSPASLALNNMATTKYAKDYEFNMLTTPSDAVKI